MSSGNYFKSSKRWIWLDLETRKFLWEKKTQKKSGASVFSQRNKLKCMYSKLEANLEEFCWKKYSKKASNHNKFNKSSSKKYENSNKNLKKRKRRNKKSFAGSVSIVYPKINMTIINNNDCSAFKSSATLSMALFACKNSYYFDTGATNHLCNARNAFRSYTKFIITQAIESIGRSIFFLSKDIKRLNVQLTNQSIMLIKFHDVYYVFSLIANLISNNSLF